MSNQRFTEQQFVTIIGRPNVGKSTLFNRLIGEERSITGEQAGVTRDRISQTLEWNDTRLTLLDTAGYKEDNTAPDDSFILEQTDTMIERSECLLFVVDAQDGVTELDRKIAQKLHAVSDRVLLVVNKVDEKGQEEHLKSDFYELGLKNLQSVSAIHNRHLDQIKSWVSANLPEKPENPDDDSSGVKLSLVGRPNVGKSTLFNSILGYDRVMVSDEPGTTRDTVSVSFDVEDRHFDLLDTGGLMRQNKVGGALDQEIVYGSLSAINSSDIVCLVLDWNERVTQQDQKIAGLIKDRYRGCIILVNKADEVDESNEESWLNHLNDRLYFLKYAPVLFTSGRTRRGLGAIFRTAADIRDEMNKTFESETLTNAFLDLKSELSWPSRVAQDVVLKVIEQTGVDPVTFTFEADNPELLSQNDLRYLSNAIRDKLNIEISPVKLRLIQDENDGN
jgi:GTP-binding protein